MRKIIRLALAVALAATAVTGCGKIYDEIDGVRTDLMSFQAGPFKDAQTQIEGLKTQVTNLETAKTAIEAEIAKLKKTTNEGHEARIAALEASVAQINTTITGIQTTITTIQTNLAKKTDKQYVDDAIATVNGHITTVETLAGAAKTAADAAQTAADAAQTDATQALADAAAAKAAAVAAQTDATQALADIAALKAVVDAMYTNGEIDAQFDGLKSYVDTEDQKLKAEIDVIKADLQAKVADLLAKIQNNEAALDSTNTVLAKAEKDIKDLTELLKQSDEALRIKLAALEKDVKNYVGDLASRMTSVAVVPADSVEIVTKYLGDQEISTFVTSVIVSPASAAAEVADQFKTNKNAVKVAFKNGLTRKSSGNIPSVEVTSVVNEGDGKLAIYGDVTCKKPVVKNGPDTLTYYAVQLTMKDTVATAANTVTSDFVRAHQNRIDLMNDVTLIWYMGSDAYSTDAAQSGGATNYQPFINFGKDKFKERMFVIGTSTYIEPGVRYNETNYNAQTFEAATGMKLNFTYDAALSKVGTYDGDIYDWFDTTGTSGFSASIVGKKDQDTIALRPLYKAPGKVNGVGFTANNFKVNGVSMPGFQYTKSFAADYYEHKVVTLDPVTVEWNYLASAGKGVTDVLVDTSKSKELKLSWHPGYMETKTSPTKSSFTVKSGKNIAGKQIDTIQVYNATLGDKTTSDNIVLSCGNAGKWANRYLVAVPIKYGEIPAIGKDTVKVTLDEMVLPVNAAVAKVVTIVLDAIKQNGGVNAYTKGLAGNAATPEAVSTAFAKAAQAAGAFKNIKINDVAQSQESTVIANQIYPTAQLVFKPGVFAVGKSYKIDAYLSAFGGTYHVQFNVIGAPAVN